MKKIVFGGLLGALIGCIVGAAYGVIGGALLTTTAVVTMHMTVMGGFVGLWITTVIVGPTMDSADWHAGARHEPHAERRGAKHAERLRDLAQTH